MWFPHGVHLVAQVRGQHVLAGDLHIIGLRPVATKINGNKLCLAWSKATNTCWEVICFQQQSEIVLSSLGMAQQLAWIYRPWKMLEHLISDQSTGVHKLKQAPGWNSDGFSRLSGRIMSNETCCVHDVSVNLTWLPSTYSRSRNGRGRTMVWVWMLHILTYPYTHP